VAAARAELTAFRGQGGGAVVQWTPYGLGRRAADLPPLSRETGVHVVAATGPHQAAHYDEDTPARLRGRLAGHIVSERADGIGTSGCRPGS
jgi:phosphotriesterase-related protein